MFATLFSIALFALPALASDFHIDTPKNIQSCAPVTFSWSGGNGPYDLVIVASKEPCGDILADLGGGHKDTTMTWSKAVLPEKMFGQDVSLSLQDADGNEAWSDSIPFVKGDTSCMNTPPAGTTTVPANVAATPYSLPSASSSASPGGAAVPAGAANVGNNPLSGGALTSRQMNGSAFIISALTALLAYSL